MNAVTPAEGRGSVRAGRDSSAAARVAVGDMISRGIAKAGSRQPDDEQA